MQNDYIKGIHEIFNINYSEEFASIYQDLIGLPWSKIFVIIGMTYGISYILSHLILYRFCKKYHSIGVPSYYTKRLVKSVGLIKSFIIIAVFHHYFISPRIGYQYHLEINLLVVLSITIFCFNFWSFITEYLIIVYFKKQRKKSLAILFFFKIGKWVIFFMGLIFVSAILNLNIWSIITACTACIVALVYAGNNAIENYFGALAIAFDDSFSIGDTIQISIDSSEITYTGVVEEINFRTIKIRREDDGVVTIPNGNIARLPLVNLSQINKDGIG